MKSDAYVTGGGHWNRESRTTTHSFSDRPLDHPVRSAILDVVETDRGSNDVGSLVDELVNEREPGTGHREPGTGHRKSRTEHLSEEAPSAEASIRISLVHNHLPRLAELGAIEWDRETGTVRATDRSRSNRNEAVSAPLRPKALRSALVEALADAGAPPTIWSLPELSSTVADSVPSDVSADRIRLLAHHVHLPALSDEGIVSYAATAETPIVRYPAE